jgi:hypothetical protein
MPRMTDQDAKAKLVALQAVIAKMTQADGETLDSVDGYQAVTLAIKKFDRCDLLKNWIKQLCATINQNNCNVDDITGLALKAVDDE